MDVKAISTQTNTTRTSKQTSSMGTKEFSEYMADNSTSLDEIFKKASQKYGVSEDLLKAIGKAESGFDANATSSCGAQGIMQLMPSTAKSLGVTDSYDAEQNIMGGAKYISQLLKKYDGNTSLALAAYNAGSGNVAKYGGIPPFKETQNYVRKVLGYLQERTTIPSEKNSVTSTSSAPITQDDTETNSQMVTQTDLSELLQNLDLDQVYSYEDYGKLVSAYFQSLALTPFMDDDQSQSVNAQLQEQIDKMNQKVNAKDGETGVSDAYLAYQSGQNMTVLSQLLLSQTGDGK